MAEQPTVAAILARYLFHLHLHFIPYQEAFCPTNFELPQAGDHLAISPIISIKRSLTVLHTS